MLKQSEVHQNLAQLMALVVWLDSALLQFFEKDNENTENIGRKRKIPCLKKGCNSCELQEELLTCEQFHVKYKFISTRTTQKLLLHFNGFGRPKVKNGYVFTARELLTQIIEKKVSPEIYSLFEKNVNKIPALQKTVREILGQ